MEEMMMVMINTNTYTNITTSPTWKLYENPHYNPHHHPHQTDHNQIHTLHLPISSRKIAASFSDLTFINPFTESSHSQITSLKADLENERKARKKLESLNKKLAREATTQRCQREALERLCEDLANELSSEKAEMSRMKREIDDERIMLRTAEVIREERVQMKLLEAKILLEEKLYEIEKMRNKGDNQDIGLMKKEGENHHIKRGIRGFVEFPKVIRGITCRRSKLECQKAQLKILLKEKGNLSFNGIIPR